MLLSIIDPHPIKEKNMKSLFNMPKVTENVKTQSYSISKEAIEIIKEEAERLDRSKSWVVDNLVLNIKKT